MPHTPLLLIPPLILVALYQNTARGRPVPWPCSVTEDNSMERGPLPHSTFQTSSECMALVKINYLQNHNCKGAWEMQGSSFISPVSAADQSTHSPQAPHSAHHISCLRRNGRKWSLISFGVEIVEALKARGVRDDPEERMAFCRSCRAPPPPPWEKELEYALLGSTSSLRHIKHV